METAYNTGFAAHFVRPDTSQFAKPGNVIPSLLRSKVVCSELPLPGGDILHLPLVDRILRACHVLLQSADPDD